MAIHVWKKDEAAYPEGSHTLFCKSVKEKIKDDGTGVVSFSFVNTKPSDGVPVNFEYAVWVDLKRGMFLDRVSMIAEACGAVGDSYDVESVCPGKTIYATVAHEIGRKDNVTRARIVEASPAAVDKNEDIPF